MNCKILKKYIIYISVSLFVFYLFFWEASYYPKSFLDHFTSFLAPISAIILSLLLILINFLTIGYFLQKNLNNFRWYFDELKKLINPPIFESSNTVLLFIFLQISTIVTVNVFELSNFPFITLFPIILFLSFISKIFNKKGKIIFLISSNLLFSLTFHSVIMYKSNGIYFYNFFSDDKSCFMEKRYVEDYYEDDLDFDFICSIEEWKKKDNPLPRNYFGDLYIESYWVFLTKGFKNTLIFYLYPILAIITILNTHYFFALYHNRFLKRK